MPYSVSENALKIKDMHIPIPQPRCELDHKIPDRVEKERALI